MWVRFQAERAKAADMEKRNGEERREGEMISALRGVSVL